MEKIDNLDIKIKEKKTKDIKAYMKQYRLNKKDKIKEYNNKYFESHNPNEKFICNCGGKYSKANKSAHILTNKHLKWMIKQNDNDNEDIKII